RRSSCSGFPRSCSRSQRHFHRPHPSRLRAGATRRPRRRPECSHRVCPFDSTESASQQPFDDASKARLFTSRRRRHTVRRLPKTHPLALTMRSHGTRIARHARIRTGRPRPIELRLPSATMSVDDSELDAQLLRRFDALKDFVDSHAIGEREFSRQAPPLVLFRHSIRGPIPLQRDARDVPLLPAGEALARHFGALWRQRVGRVISSPLRRCTQTARHFLAAAELDRPVECTRILGAPGAFVRDEDGGWQDYVRFRKHELVRQARANPSGMAGYHTLEQGSLRLLAFVESLGSPESRASSTPSSTTVLGFSHDLLMSLLLSWAFDRSWADGDWPDFHEGLVVWREREEIC